MAVSATGNLEFLVVQAKRKATLVWIELTDATRTMNIGPALRAIRLASGDERGVDRRQILQALPNTEAPGYSTHEVGVLSKLVFYPTSGEPGFYATIPLECAKCS